jgi:hypothetical protein
MPPLQHTQSVIDVDALPPTQPQSIGSSTSSLSLSAGAVMMRVLPASNPLPSALPAASPPLSAGAGPSSQRQMSVKGDAASERYRFIISFVLNTSLDVFSFVLLTARRCGVLHVGAAIG